MYIYDIKFGSNKIQGRTHGKFYELRMVLRLEFIKFCQKFTTLEN